MPKPKKKISAWDIFQDKILEALEKNVVPWRQTWNGQRPMNYVSKRPYHGMNLLFLYGGETPYYLTWKQIHKLGGTVKPEETKKYDLAFYFAIMDNKPSAKTKESKTHAKSDDSGKKPPKPKQFAFMRYYKLYNLAQTTLPMPEKKLNPKLWYAEEIVENFPNPPLITTCACDPCYSPTMDVVNIPDIGDFESNTEYYAALFHELVHSTGHKIRLDRYHGGYNNRDAYSEEELVAEIGACFLRSLCGIDPPNAGIDDNSVSYIKTWHSRLKNDPAIIKRAVQAANKAVKYIVGDTYNE